MPARASSSSPRSAHSGGAGARVNPAQWRTAQIEMSTTSAWQESDLRDAGDGPGYYSTYLGTTRNERTRVSRYGEFPSEAAAKSVHSNLTRLDPHATIKYVQPVVKNPAIDDVKKQIEDAIRAGMSRYLWISAFATWAEEGAEYVGRKSGIDWDDEAPHTPPAATQAAKDLVGLYVAAENLQGSVTPMTELFEIAMTVDQGPDFNLIGYDGWGFIMQLQVGTGKKRKIEAVSLLDVAKDFGMMMAAEALGEGVAWSDDHIVKDARGTKFDPSTPGFECYFDGAELDWYGSTHDRRDDGVSGHGAAPGAGARGEQPTTIGRITVVNPNDKDFHDHTYVLWFSAGGSTPVHLLAYADSLESGLDECVDYLEDQGHEGYFVDDEVNEEYQRLVAEGVDEDEAMEQAEADTTSAGNAGRRLSSQYWGFDAEDPTPQQLALIANGGGV